jgi:prepilin-type N-terminal cleavage/methylation domain-containing protein
MTQTQWLRRHKKKRGFSLIEVMAAAAILGVGLAATFSAFSGGTSLFEHQRHTTVGIHLSEGKLEELLIRASSDVELQPGTVFGPEWFDRSGIASGVATCPASTAGTPPTSADCRYRVTWESVPGGVPKVRVLTVTTTWAERGEPKSISFSTQRN